MKRESSTRGSVVDLSHRDRPVPEADDELVGWLGPHLAGRWRDLRLVGGTSSRVFVGHDDRLGRDVAVKVLVGAGVQLGGVPAEPRVQAAVSDHPHILTLLEAGVTPGGFAFMVLEHAPGGPWGGLPNPSLDAILARGAEVADALAACHARGFVHADVKPSNVLLGDDGSARLADFGIAGRAEDVLGTLDDLRGSLHFVAPELLDGARPLPPVDVYALAVTLWTVAVGRMPFGGAAAHPAAVMAQIQAAGLTFGDTPLAAAGPEVVAALDAATSPRPSDRPTAAELANTLQRAAGRLGGGFTAEPPGRSPRAKVVLGGAAAMLALAAGVVAISRLDAPAASADPPYCSVYRAAIDGRGRLYEQVAEDLELASNPTTAVYRLLETYPTRYARITGPWLARAATLTHNPDAALSSVELKDLAVADAIRSLTGGKATLGEGADGSLPVDELPGELRGPASALSSADRDAATRCPEVDTDQRAAKARMSSAIVSNLTDKTFMDRFFDDPRSVDVISARQVSLMATVAGEYFGLLLAQHWDFMLRMCDRRPAVRAEIAFDHPDIILAALRSRPDMVGLVQRPEWKADLQRGLGQLAPSARRGIEVVYRQELASLGLGS